MRICVVGEGAQAQTYCQVLGGFPRVQVATLCGGLAGDTARFAQQWGIPHHSLELDECLAQPGIEAVIDTSPSQLHAAHARRVLGAGKHLLLEIPMALSLADAQALVELERRSGLCCMVAHTRRFTPSFIEVQRRIAGGELLPLHLAFHTYFFRRRNLNRFGQPRTWVDDLLWHHACHQVDAVCWFLGDAPLEVWGQAGPRHPELGIVMDLTIGMRDAAGRLVSGTMSFNHHGPIDVGMRVIGAQSTLILQPRRNRLVDYQGTELVRYDPLDPFAGQLAEFFDAIAQRRAPLTSFQACLPAMRLLDRIQTAIALD